VGWQDPIGGNALGRLGLQHCTHQFEWNWSSGNQRKRDLFAPDRYTTASSRDSTVRGPPDSRRLGRRWKNSVGEAVSMSDKQPVNSDETIQPRWSGQIVCESTSASDWPPIRVQEFLAAWICQPLNPRKEFVLRQRSQRIFIVVLKFLPRGCPSQNRAFRWSVSIVHWPLLIDCRIT